MTMKKLTFLILLFIIPLITQLTPCTTILKADPFPGDKINRNNNVFSDKNTVIKERYVDNNIQGQSPIIFFKTPNFNFDKIYKGEKVEHRFIFKNGGKAPLKISKVESSCGCTAAILTKKIIPPGETGEIKTTFNSSSFHGRVSKSITVTSNALNKPVYKLTISGEVIELISAHPKRINYASISIESNMDKTITVTSDTSFSIHKLTSTIPFLNVSIETEKENEYAINVSSKGKHEIGRFNGAIFLETDNKIQPKVTIPVFGNIIGDITTYPLKLYYGNIKKGNERTQKVFVKLNKENIKILGVKVTPDYLSNKIIENHQQNRAQFLIEVKLNTNAPIGKLNGLLEIYTNSKIQPVIQVPITGEVIL